uniref:Conotoxin n=1 Tax=Conus praecellens TaxID=128530 RepID=A0A291C2B0_CONPC|nr:conotoxin [Conus praecellens]
MQKALLSALLVISLVVVEVTRQKVVKPVEPVKPDKFKSIVELEAYLEKLNDYYRILSKPRFGRSLNISKRSRKEHGALRS